MYLLQICILITFSVVYMFQNAYIICVSVRLFQAVSVCFTLQISVVFDKLLLTDLILLLLHIYVLNFNESIVLLQMLVMK